MGPRGPYAHLSPCAQSHAFDERRVCVPCCEEEALKIGRSVARWKPAVDNAIFDCKVLSRNHALLWFEEGIFWLKDTKSSNGTFVNSERLSRSAEESAPRQIFSGDILQFGVEIVENANKVTHGCIVAMVRLFDAKGEEVCAPEFAGSHRASECGETALAFGAHQLFQLQQYIREAAHRERMLDQKLVLLEGVLLATDQATESSWQALINEDRLLSRIEMLEGQLALYSKNVPTDKVKEEMHELLADKNKFETLAKDSLRRAYELKNDAQQRVSDCERSLLNAEEETATQRDRVVELERELANAVALNASLSEALSQAQRRESLAQAELRLQISKSNYDRVTADSVQQENMVEVPIANEDAESDECPPYTNTSQASNSYTDTDGRIVYVSSSVTTFASSDVASPSKYALDGSKDAPGHDDSFEGNAMLRNEYNMLLNENFALKRKLAEYESRNATAKPNAVKNNHDEKATVELPRAEIVSRALSPHGDYFWLLLLCSLPLFAVSCVAWGLFFHLKAFRHKAD